MVVYDTIDHRAHALSPEAASVWERCDGMRSSAQIASELEVGGELVDVALDELQSCGLLVGSARPQRWLSRREAGAVLAKGALLAPLIFSVGIPAAASAASGGTCPVGAVSGTCHTGATATMPTGGSVLVGGEGFTTSCPTVGGNIYDTNCYLTLSGATVCTGSTCIPGLQGCTPGSSNVCCAGSGCCTPVLGFPGTYHCSQ